MVGHGSWSVSLHLLLHQFIYGGTNTEVQDTKAGLLA